MKTKLNSQGGSGAPDCSVSSETPETDAICSSYPYNRPNIHSELSRKLEIQRNGVVALLEWCIEDLYDGTGDEIGAKQLRARLRAIVPQNR